MRAIAAILTLSATCWAPPVPVPATDLIMFWHGGRPHVAPARNIVSTGRFTVLVDGVTFQEDI